MDGHRILYRDFIMAPAKVLMYIYIYMGSMSFELTRNTDLSSSPSTT